MAGFGQPVVVLLAAVSIVGEGLIATGVAYRLGEAVMKAGGSNEVRLMALVMMLAGTVGAFTNSVRDRRHVYPGRFGDRQQDRT